MIPLTPTAPGPMVTAPVEVRNVPVDPEKLLAPDPDAVRPLAMTGVVIVHEVPVLAPVNVFAASVLATVKAASGIVIVRAAVAPEKVNSFVAIGKYFAPPFTPPMNPLAVLP